MDELKQSVQNAVYEQKDPLLIYKFESYELFQTMLNKINRDVLAFLLRAHIPTRDTQNIHEARQPVRRNDKHLQTSHPEAAASGGSEPRTQMPVHAEKKVGRNDPCPCGSGKKYKNCHGANK